jgi:hypothetical protein
MVFALFMAYEWYEKYIQANPPSATAAVHQRLIELHQFSLLHIVVALDGRRVGDTLGKVELNKIIKRASL